MENFKNYISEIKNFPKKGIFFKDINPIYKEPKIWKELMIPLEKLVQETRPDYLIGIESRGFISASALAFKFETGFIPIRKANKLPGKIIGIDYQLEYGQDRLEIQSDLIKKDSNVIVIDDLLATGGTASTAGKLINKVGANLIGFGFLVELTSLNGRKNLDNSLLIESVLKY